MKGKEEREKTVLSDSVKVKRRKEMTSDDNPRRERERE